MASFDPYQKWLGISAAQQPPNHYCLLGLANFESDEKVIEDACAQRIAKLQDLSHGENVELAQKLLNDVARAKLCLTTKADKFKYDLGLRKSLSGANKPKPVAAPQPATAHQVAPAAAAATPLAPSQPTAPVVNAAPHSPAPARPATKQKTKPVGTAKKKSKPKGSSAMGMAIGGLAALALTLIGGVILYASGVFDGPSDPTAKADYFDESWQPDSTQTSALKTPDKKPTNNAAKKKEKKPRFPAPPPAEKKPNKKKNNGQKKKAAAKSKKNDSAKREETKAMTKGPDTVDELDLPIGNWAPDDGSPVHGEWLNHENLDEWKALKSKYAAVQGTVKYTSQSGSKKTRYIWFGRKKKTGCIIVPVSRAKGISKEFMDSLRGKSITVTGKMKVESNSGRVGLEITKRAQIKINK